MLKYPNTIIAPTYNEVLFNILYEIASAEGSQFFNTIVESIARHLGVKYVLIGEYLPESFTVKAKSFWADTTLVEKFQYSIINTPCEHVLSGDAEITAYPKNIQQIFPNDLDLVSWEVESYVGKPLFDSKKKVIGHIAVLDSLPIENVDLVITVLETCSNRIAGELERAINDRLTQNKTKELAASLSLLEATIESTADGLLIVDQQGKMVRFNKQFVEMWRVPQEVIDARDDQGAIECVLSQLEHPEQFVAKVAELYENPEAVSFDVLYFKDGRVFERYSQPQRIGDTIEGRVWSFRDVTQKIQAEEELKESEFIFRSLFEESPIGIVIDVHPKNKLVKINDKMCRMLGYTPEELAQMTAADVTHPEDRRNYVSGFRSVAANQRPDCNFEKRYVTKEGEIIWGSVSLSVVRKKDGNVKHRVVMIQDITEEKKAALALEEKASELNEKNKELKKYIDSNLQLENFAYIASHDLREPLLTTMGLIELMIESYGSELNEEANSFLQFIDQSVKSMDVLINDLLTYSRVNTQSHTAENFDLQRLAQKVIAGLQKTIHKENATIHLHNIPKDFYGNETKMFQLLQNLISNAIKFRKKDISPIINISVKYFDNYWQFAIADNGIGIAPEFHQQIFLLFKKLHSKYEYEGTGIGLATCKKIVEHHGGKIWIASELGKGTTFYFTIAKCS